GKETGRFPILKGEVRKLDALAIAQLDAHRGADTRFPVEVHIFGSKDVDDLPCGEIVLLAEEDAILALAPEGDRFQARVEPAWSGWLGALRAVANDVIGSCRQSRHLFLHIWALHVGAGVRAGTGRIFLSAGGTGPG